MNSDVFHSGCLLSAAYRIKGQRPQSRNRHNKNCLEHRKRPVQRRFFLYCRWAGCFQHINYGYRLSAIICFFSLQTRCKEKIVASISLMGCAKKMPFTSQNAGKIYRNGRRKTTCRNTVMTIDGVGRLIDWKNVVASMTNPNTGVMQKLIRKPVTPIWNISSVPPNAARICLGKNSTASQMIQVMETENKVA